MIMQTYRISLFKDLVNSTGHQVRCLQSELDIEAEDVTRALHLVQARLMSLSLDVDGVEVRSVPIANRRSPTIAA
jgi:hypothetical protein